MFSPMGFILAFIVFNIIIVFFLDFLSENNILAIYIFMCVAPLFVFISGLLINNYLF